MSVLGYDTVRATRVQRGIPDASWDRRTRHETPTGDSVQAIASVGGIRVGYDRRAGHDEFDGELWFETSLPKLLWGHNAADLHQLEDIDQAVDLVNGKLSKFLGKSDEVWEWTLNRCDVTADRQLPDEEAVAVVLSRLRDVRIRNRRPILGESGSVSWPGKRGGFNRKFYSKFAESDQDAARGRLRIEVGALGHKALRRMLPGGQELPAVTVMHLMSKESELMRARMTAPMLKVVDAAMRGLADMNAWDLMKMLHEKGMRADRASNLLGQVFYINQFGWAAAEARMSRQAIWKLRRTLNELGIVPAEIEFDSAKISDDELGQGDPAVDVGIFMANYWQLERNLAKFERYALEHPSPEVDVLVAQLRSGVEAGRAELVKLGLIKEKKGGKKDG
jgi:hypothetical protein